MCSAPGTVGDVLWDTSTDDELRLYRELAVEHFDPSLPIIDLGCGNGRFTRGFADLCSVAVGVDLASAAVQRAAAESTEAPGKVEFAAWDITSTECGPALRKSYGESNVFIRGVLHVLSAQQRRRVASTVSEVVGDGGRVLLAETDFRAGTLAYLEHLGAAPTRIPPPVAKAIAMLPRPHHYGKAESADAFPRTDWTVLEERPTTILTVPTRTETAPETVPGYLAVLARRS